MNFKKIQERKVLAIHPVKAKEGKREIYQLPLSIVVITPGFLQELVLLPRRKRPVVKAVLCARPAFKSVAFYNLLFKRPRTEGSSVGGVLSDRCDLVIRQSAQTEEGEDYVQQLRW